MLTSYKHIEDYLEILAGYDPTNFLMPAPATFSLARYDTNIVYSMAGSTSCGLALTDKQGELAIRLVLKYRKQFAAQGIDITPAETPVWRKPLRTIDRTKSVSLEDDQIIVRFPYDTELIAQVKSYIQSSMGSVKWNKDDKTWMLGLTEGNVNWAVAWGESFGFNISTEVRELYDQIIESEQTLYEIKLITTDDGYAITNAAAGMIEYIETKLGGFSKDNIVALVDNAGVLGYTVSAAILEEVNKQYDSALEKIGTKHAVHISPDPETLDWIFEYAELTNRYPICIYNPAVADLDLSRFKEEDIVRFDRNGKTKTRDYDPYNVKVVYAQKIPTTWDFPVPLLISTFEMMFGGRKMDWAQRADRIIYYTESKLRKEE